MTRDQELKIIENVRGLVSNKKFTEIAEEFYAAMPESYKLDATGAALDAKAEVYAIHGRMPEESGQPPDEARVLTIAASIRCSQTRCVHANPLSSTVLFAALAPRVLSCKKCIMNFASIFKAHDAARSRSDECDLCLRTGVTQFRDTTIQFQNVIFMGDICEDCHRTCIPGANQCK